jgi:arylformamidase
LYPADGHGLAGALMISGIYDISQADANQFQRAYYGEARENWAAYSTVNGLVASELPLLFSVSEYDGADFQRQASLLPTAFTRSRGWFPRLHWLAGHNHLSPVLAIGSAADTLGPFVRDFIETVSR